MKKIGLIVVTLLVAGAVSSWAQTNDYLVKVRATITDNTGKHKISETDLVSTNGNVLVLRLVKNSPRLIALQERDSSGTNTVSTLIDSFREAFLDNGQFSADLEDQSLTQDGDIQIQGKEAPASKPKKVTAKLVGVFNDKISGNTNLVDSLFSGVISGSLLP